MGMNVGEFFFSHEVGSNCLRRETPGVERQKSAPYREVIQFILYLSIPHPDTRLTLYEEEFARQRLANSWRIHNGDFRDAVSDFCGKLGRLKTRPNEVLM